MAFYIKKKTKSDFFNSLTIQSKKNNIWDFESQRICSDSAHFKCDKNYAWPNNK